MKISKFFAFFLMISLFGTAFASQSAEVIGVAVGHEYANKTMHGMIMTTNDGANWIKQNIGNSDFTAVGWNGKEWMIISESGNIFTSPDAVTWSFSSMGEAANNAKLRTLAWNGKEWLISGGVVTKDNAKFQNLVLWYGSVDNWAVQPISDVTSGFDTLSLKSVYDGKQWLGVLPYELHSELFLSSNSYKWERVSLPVKSYVADVQGTIDANGKRTWVVVGEEILTSHDGKHWLLQKHEHTFNSVDWNGKQWVAAGAEIMISDDAITWTSVSVYEYRNIVSLAWDKKNSKWYGVGHVGDRAIMVTSDQSGSQWKEVDLKLKSGVNARINGIAIKN